MTPGAAEYWEHFYDSSEDGVLVEKSRKFRKALQESPSPAEQGGDDSARKHNSTKKRAAAAGSSSTNSTTGSKQRDGAGGDGGGDGEDATVGVLLAHYEWFMRYDVYRNELLAACRAAQLFTPAAVADQPQQDGPSRKTGRELRILHVGCGNSDMCDRLSSDAVEEIHLAAAGAFSSSSAVPAAAGRGGKGSSRQRGGKRKAGDVAASPVCPVMEEASPPPPAAASVEGSIGSEVSPRCEEPPFQQQQPHPDTLSVAVVNVDICASLMRRLTRLYPHRTYCAGDCCDMLPSDVTHDDSGSEEGTSGSSWYTACLPRTAAKGRRCDEEVEKAVEWYTPLGNAAGTGVAVASRSVDLVADKGTLDALLSAFPGEENPNAASYVAEALRVLRRPGGLFVLISINALSVVAPYIYAATLGTDTTSKDTDDGDASSVGFRLVHQSVIDMGKASSPGSRVGGEDPAVEMLGTHYNIFGFVVVSS
jgi:hypothetical protein